MRSGCEQTLRVIFGMQASSTYTRLQGWSFPSEFPDEPVEAIIGGLHLFPASDEQLDWTADRMKDFRVAKVMGAHCTGIEAVYRIRERLALPRDSTVVGSVGSSFVLGEGIHPRVLAGDSARQQTPYRCHSRNHGLCASVSSLPLIRSRNVARTERSGVRHGEDALKPLDFSDGLFGVHRCQYSQTACCTDANRSYIQFPIPIQRGPLHLLLIEQ